jgi:hypothetical protein
MSFIDLHDVTTRKIFFFWGGGKVILDIATNLQLIRRRDTCSLCQVFLRVFVWAVQLRELQVNKSQNSAKSQQIMEIFLLVKQAYFALL